MPPSSVESEVSPCTACRQSRARRIATRGGRHDRVRGGGSEGFDRTGYAGNDHLRRRGERLPLFSEGLTPRLGATSRRSSQRNPATGGAGPGATGTAHPAARSHRTPFGRTYYAHYTPAGLGGPEASGARRCDDDTYAVIAPLSRGILRAPMAPTLLARFAERISCAGGRRPTIISSASGTALRVPGPARRAGWTAPHTVQRPICANRHLSAGAPTASAASPQRIRGLRAADRSTQPEPGGVTTSCRWTAECGLNSRIRVRMRTIPGTSYHEDCARARHRSCQLLAAITLASDLRCSLPGGSPDGGRVSLPRRLTDAPEDPLVLSPVQGKSVAIRHPGCALIGRDTGLPPG